MAINNPYIPGDPYSYDLKWMVQEVKKAQAVGEEAAGSAQAAAASAEAAAASEEAAAASEEAIRDIIITPEMFGAIGDGIHDDTAALQECIQDNAIVILKNTYLITAPLDFTGKKNLTIKGGKITRPADQLYNTICGRNCNNIRLENIELDGNGNNQNMAYSWPDNVQACIILASQCKNIFIEKCKILNYNYGVFILGADVENAPVSFDNTSLNGKISNCVFHNCNSAIDTYGKGIVIENNVFYDITRDAIALEPVSEPAGADNPLEDSTYYESSVSNIVENNLLINIARYGITTFQNIYSTIIANNTIINFTTAINVGHAEHKAIIVKNNIVINQHEQTINSSKQPWSYDAAITSMGNTIVSENMILGAYVGIYSRGGDSILNNTIYSPKISGIIHYTITALLNAPAVIKGNVIKGFVHNTSAIWKARAICSGYSNLLFIVNNIIECDGQPLFVPSESTAIITDLFSSIAMTDTINRPADWTINNN